MELNYENGYDIIVDCKKSYNKIYVTVYCMLQM